jgi:hypothetical protein
MPGFVWREDANHHDSGKGGGHSDEFRGWRRPPWVVERAKVCIGGNIRGTLSLEETLLSFGGREAL